MTYIPGYSFQASYVFQINENQTMQNRRTTDKFELNKSYTINFIKKKEESVEYTFVDSNKEKITIEFPSIYDAETAIARAIGLNAPPKYDHIYEKRI